MESLVRGPAKATGALVPAVRQPQTKYSFTATGVNGGSIIATFQLPGWLREPRHGQLSILPGRATMPSPNQSVIIIRDNTNATPYPCPVFVNGVLGRRRQPGFGQSL